MLTQILVGALINSHTRMGHLLDQRPYKSRMGPLALKFVQTKARASRALDRRIKRSVYARAAILLRV